MEKRMSMKLADISKFSFNNSLGMPKNKKMLSRGYSVESNDASFLGGATAGRKKRITIENTDESIMRMN